MRTWNEDRLAALSFVSDDLLCLASTLRATLYLDHTFPSEIVEFCDAALTLLGPVDAGEAFRVAAGELAIVIDRQKQTGCAPSR